MNTGLNDFLSKKDLLNHCTTKLRYFRHNVE